MAKWMDLRHTYNLKGKLLLSCLGVVCIALGTTVCRVGNVGVDPFTAMNLGFSARVGMDFGTFQLLVNLAILAAVFALDKYQIGLGTLINMVGVGYLIELFTWLLGFLPKFEGLVSAGVHLVVGTLLFTLGVSLYLKTRMGVAPIDAIAPIAAERLPFSYTACRMTQDADRGGIRTIAFGEGGGEAHVVRADGCGANPTYLAQRGSLLFAAHELDSCGRMAAYAIEPDGSLTCRGACTAPYDAGTCFVLPDPNGRNLFGANYLSGSVACCALLDDGRLAAGVPSRRHEGRGLRDDRQEGPHVHSLSFVPGTRLLVAVDLGLDALVIYQVDAPSGDALAAHIAFSPDGRQLYASVRGSDQLVVFPVDGQGRVAGRCDVASGGKGPRHFSPSPDGRFLAVANLASDDVRLFERDADGMLRAVACVDVPQPACVIWNA